MKILQIWAVTLLVTVAVTQNTDSGFIKTMLESHNSVRKMHSAKDLTWNNDASKWAQNWCQQLAKTDKFGHSKNSGYGENLYWSSRILTDGSLWGTAATKSWYSEEQYWDYVNSDSKDGKTTGHFTQVVWKSTTELGCGFAVNDVASAKMKGTFVCCNYKPGGNMKGKYAENVGTKTDVNPTPDPTKCEWTWGSWSKCTAATTSGTTGCYKSMEQSCSCKDVSKCSGTKEAAKKEVCKCESNTCKWEWGSWSKCMTTSTGGTTGCYRSMKQMCNCGDGKCKTEDQQATKVEKCDCNNNKCEWRWGKWGSCPMADDTNSKCYRVIKQECSCKSEADCEGTKQTKREVCDCSDMAVKLIGGTEDSGNLAIMIDRTEGWKSVCDDGWSDTESKAVCRGFGFEIGKLVSTEMFKKNTLSFGFTDTKCAVAARSLDNCEATEYGEQGVTPCHWKEKVALKCCNDWFKFEITDAKVKCNRKGVKCKFACAVNAQKQCEGFNVSDVEVKIYHVSKAGKVNMLRSLKYKKRKNIFNGRSVFKAKLDSDCFVFEASIAGMASVKKSIGTC